MKTYNVAQIADMFDVTDQTVRKWIHKGELIANKTSNRTGYVVTEADLDQFCEEYDMYGDDEVEELSPEEIIDERIDDSVDRMIANCEHQLRGLEVKLETLYRLRERLESY